MKAGFQHQLRDADLLDSFACPAAASSSTTSDTFDTGARTSMATAPPVEAVVKVPALSTTIAPDTRTVTLIVETDTDSNMGSPTTLASKTLTGAGGAGISASELRVILPPDCERYVRGKVTFGASTTDGSAVSAEFALLCG